MRRPASLALRAALLLFAGGVGFLASPARSGGQEPAASAQVDLSPQATAARAMAASLEPLQDAGAGQTRERELVEKISGLVRASDASAKQTVERAAEESIWRILVPWRNPRLLRKARYWYIGHTVDALIFEDGAVEFRHKQGVTLSPVSFATIEKHGGSSQGALPNARDPSDAQGTHRALGAPSGLGLGIGVAQPGRVFARLVNKQEPPNAEAERFLRDTRALREHLTARAEEQHLAREDRELDRLLKGLWERRGALAPGQPEQQTFELWDACADDERGDRGRERIEAFVRTVELASGQCPFTAERLERLNAKRRSKRVFAPCVGVTAR